MAILPVALPSELLIHYEKTFGNNKSNSFNVLFASRYLYSVAKMMTLLLVHISFATPDSLATNLLLKLNMHIPISVAYCPTLTLEAKYNETKL
jgi:hypothetical protein